jgi:hypothetical protein
VPGVLSDQDLFDLVDGLSRASVGLAFAWRSEPTKWPVEKVPIVGELPTSFHTIAMEAAKDVYERRSFAEYNAEGGLRDNEYFELANPRAADGKAAAIAGNLFPQLDDYTNARNFGERPRKTLPKLYVIVASIGSDGEPAKFGRQLRARNVLSRSFGVRMFYSDGTFSELEAGDVIAVDEQVDWIEWRGQVLVLNDKAFHDTFRSVAALRAAVSVHIDTLDAAVPIINKDAFAERCTRSVAMMTKLQNVIDQQLYLKPVSELKAYSARYPELGVQWQRDALVFDGGFATQWSILNLFDEAGFTGGLSGLKFEAPAKRPLRSTSSTAAPAAATPAQAGNAAPIAPGGEADASSDGSGAMAGAAGEAPGAQSTADPTHERG